MKSDQTSGVDFPALDVLRLVGALAVLTTHVAFQTGEYFPNGVVGTLLARMDIGVAIFFVLSGFLLSRPWWASAASGTPAPMVGRYALKRLLRIWPVYLVTDLHGYGSREAHRIASSWRKRRMFQTMTGVTRSMITKASPMNSWPNANLVGTDGSREPRRIHSQAKSGARTTTKNG